MKKLLFLSLLLLLVGATSSWADCKKYDYYLDIHGFACGTGVGSICFITSADWADPTDCGDYVVELIYATGTFIYTDLGDFSLYSFNQTTTVLRYLPQLFFDTQITGCLEGVLQVPGTVFTLRVVSAVNPNDIVATSTFTLDQANTVGGPGQTTLLSDAIAQQDLLPAAQAATTGQTVIVDGTLVIDTNYEFNTAFGGKYNEIIMRPGARIEVLDGVLFNTYRTTIHGCEDTWDRINIQSGGTYTCWFTNISDATVAVELQDHSELSLAIIDFYDNETAIASYGPNTKDVNILLFSDLFIPSQIRDGQVGCHFENVSLVNLNGNFRFLNMETDGIYLDHTDLNAKRLRFSECREAGIRVANQNTMLTVDHCAFEHGEYGVLTLGSSDLRVTSSVFSNLTYGVARGSATVGEHTFMQDNHLYLCEMDVLAIVLPSSAEIQFNDLRANRTNVGVWGYGVGEHKWAIQHNTNMQAGNAQTPGYNVSFLNVKGGRVFRNINAFSTYRNLSVYGGSDVKIGYNIPLIASNNANIAIFGSPNGTVYCNTTEGPLGLNVISTCTGTEIRGNTLSGEGLNLAYGTPGSVFATTGPQLYKGNLFDESSEGNVKVINYSDLSTAQLNYFQLGFLAGAQGTEYNPFFTSAYNKWFDKDFAGTDYTCPPGFTDPGPVDVDRIRSAAAVNIAHLNGSAGSVYGQATAFDLKLKLFRFLDELNEKSSLTSVEQSWYGALGAISTGKAVAFEKAFANAAAFSAAEAAQAEGLKQQIGDLTAAINALEWYGFDGAAGTFTVNPTLKTEFELKQADLTETAGDLRDLLNARHNSLLAASHELASLNAQITGMEIPAQNLRAVNGLLLARLSAGFAGFTASEVQTLSGIANQCASLGGEGVFSARALLADVTKSIAEYNDECLGGNMLRGDLPAPAPATGVIALFPNPAGDYSTITLERGHSCTGLSVRDLLGRLVERIPVEAGQTYIPFKIDWKPGVYFLTAENSGLPAVKLTVTR